MVKKIVITIFFLSATSMIHLSASMIEPYFVSKYDNVSISSPVRKERSIHAEMAGKYAAMLAKEFGYTEDILIEFDYFNPEFYGINQKFTVNYTTTTPCHVKGLGRELVAIILKSTARENPIDRTVIYVITKDEVILNLEELLKKNLAGNAVCIFNFNR